MINTLATSAWLVAAAVISSVALADEPKQGSIVRLDPALDEIIAPGATLESLADLPGRFTREGPVWISDGGFLIYTVRNGNRQPGNPPPTDSDIAKWDPRTGQATVFLRSTKADGNTVDGQGRIVSAVNIGEGQVVRVEKDGKRTVLANQYGDRPLSPNDLVYKSDGTLYFSSPGRTGSPAHIPGLFMIKDEKLQLLTPTPAIEVGHPGGLAFSPDEKQLYVTDNPRVLRFDVMPDNTLANGHVFLDLSDRKPLQNFPDGVKVDSRGNVYVTAPGGVWILSPAGKHLGTIVELNRPANLAFGGEDGKTLFITSRPGLSRLSLKVAGHGVSGAPASRVSRLDPALDAVLSPDARLEVVHSDAAVSFEGPTWVNAESSGYLLVSVRPGNVIRKLAPHGAVSDFLVEPFRGETSTWGSNGIALDPQGRVVFAGFTAGQIVRVESSGERTVLADHYKGQRINTPNDLVYRSDGSLYFTDSTSKRPGPAGVPHTGLYRIGAGKLQLLASEGVGRLNGLAFSSDEKQLYLCDADGKRILRFDVEHDGTITNKTVFAEMPDDPRGPDGMKVDASGNVYVAGASGVWIWSRAGKLLGKIVTAEHATNVAFGGADAKTLYVTGRTFVARIPLQVAGARR